MQQYEIELPGGGRLAAGAGERCAVSQARLTRCVNAQTELMSGGVCAAVLEVSVLDPEGLLAVSAGEEWKLYKGDMCQGVFITQKPERSGSVCRVTAYDRVSLLDREVGQWLSQLPGWPYTLEQLAGMVCAQCDLTLSGQLSVNREYVVERFSLSQVTARQLMQWICQLGGSFCRANAQGTLELGWFRQTEICLRPTGDSFYYRDGLSGAEFVTAEVEKVHLRRSDEDVGAVYPAAEAGSNTLCVTGNPLLGSDAGALEEAARQLYTQFHPIRYMPCTVRTVESCGVTAGDIFQVEKPDGTVQPVYAMTCVHLGGVLTVQCTGSGSRDSSQAVNIARYESEGDRVVSLRADVEGLKAQCRDDRGALAELTMDVEGIRTQVSRVDAAGENTRSQLTRLEQDARALSLQVQTITETGAGKVVTETGYTFDTEGLKISKAGEEMENLLDNTGMYVRRSGQTILQANAAGVQAKDVTVRSYLIIGSHCRLEDYADAADSKRTACFFLE